MIGQCFSLPIMALVGKTKALTNHEKDDVMDMSSVLEPYYERLTVHAIYSLSPIQCSQTDRNKINETMHRNNSSPSWNSFFL